MMRIPMVGLSTVFLGFVGLARSSSAVGRSRQQSAAAVCGHRPFTERDEREKGG